MQIQNKLSKSISQTVPIDRCFFIENIERFVSLSVKKLETLVIKTIKSFSNDHDSA
jgi:hypothetical protein